MIARVLGLLAICLFVSPVFALTTKDEQKGALAEILSELRVHYGMIQFKEKAFGLSYEKLRQKYERLIDSGLTLEEDAGMYPPTPREILPAEEFEQLMIGLAAELKDGHTNIGRKTMERWSIGMQTAELQGRLYITGFIKSLYTAGVTNPEPQVGDEIIEINGRPVRDLARERMLYSQTATYDSRFRAGLESLLNVSHYFHRAVNAGEAVNVTFLRKNKKFTGRFHWVAVEDRQDLETARTFLPDYVPPKERDAEYFYGSRGPLSEFSQGLKGMGFARGTLTDVAALLNSQIKEAKERRQKELPTDGLADLSVNTRIPVYTIRYQGKSIGVIRIPDYSPMGSLIDELLWLSNIIEILENSTDGLIIDQLNNGGGYVYEFAQFIRLFATEPIELNTIDMRLSKTLLDSLSSWAYSTETSRRIDGQKPSYGQFQLHQNQLNRLREKFKNGERWSGPVSFAGHLSLQDNVAGQVAGKGSAVYTHKVVIANNQRSASGGDFMPAVMQQAKRAVIWGQTSMGLGGPVYRSQPSMPSSEMSMRCTFGLCRTADGRIFENVGVVPDVRREVTPEDFKSGFVEYARDLLDVAVATINGTDVKGLNEFSSKALSKRHAAPSSASKKIEEHYDKLRVSLSQKANPTEIMEEYWQAFNRLAKEDWKELSDGEWRKLRFPLPDFLLEQDFILASLIGHEEIRDRLEQMQLLKHPDEATLQLVDVIADGLDMLEKQREKTRCEALFSTALDKSQQ